jgi:hypothetical protein
MDTEQAGREGVEENSRLLQHFRSTSMSLCLSIHPHRVRALRLCLGLRTRLRSLGLEAA